MHTTNYYNTFIEVADDSKALYGFVSESKTDKKTVAQLQFEIISKNPYTYTSDDVIFQVYSLRNDLIEDELKLARETFFSKGQPCLRASPLSKTCGFGVHFDTDGKIAIYGIESEKYSHLLADPQVKKLKAMRSSKK